MVDIDIERERGREGEREGKTKKKTAVGWSNVERSDTRCTKIRAHGHKQPMQWGTNFVYHYSATTSIEMDWKVY